jgi:hypothetical protein
VKTITLTNTTQTTWRLKPVFENDYWFGSKHTIKIPPAQSANYDISYLPLSMTIDKQEHRGTVFFALPDGGGLLYQLIGQVL